MDKLIDEKRSLFLQKFADIPENLRSEIIVVIDEKPYTWNTAYFEIKENTDLGWKILNTLVTLGIL